MGPPRAGRRRTPRRGGGRRTGAKRGRPPSTLRAPTASGFDRSNTSGEYTNEQLEKAFDYMLLAEGSDWFWWYGSDQSSSNDDYFGSAFRNLLKNVYTALGEKPPAYLDIPIISPTAKLFDKPSDSILDTNQTLLINGATNKNIWSEAGESHYFRNIHRTG